MSSKDSSHKIVKNKNVNHFTHYMKRNRFKTVLQSKLLKVAFEKMSDFGFGIG